MKICNLHRALVLAAALLFLGGCAASSGSHLAHQTCPHCKGTHAGGMVCASTQVR